MVQLYFNKGTKIVYYILAILNSQLNFKAFIGKKLYNISLNPTLIKRFRNKIYLNYSICAAELNEWKIKIKIMLRMLQSITQVCHS